MLEFPPKLRREWSATIADIIYMYIYIGAFFFFLNFFSTLHRHTSVHIYPKRHTNEREMTWTLQFHHRSDNEINAFLSHTYIKLYPMHQLYLFVLSVNLISSMLQQDKVEASHESNNAI